MRTIILAAGQGFRLGGYNKLLLRNPLSGNTIIEDYIEQFKGTEITVVVGYNAVNIISNYPKLNYIFNEDWSTTKDSISLSLALDERPSYVIPSDLFFKVNVRKNLDSIKEDCVLTVNNDSRTLDSFNCVIKKGVIKKIYQGQVESPNDPQLVDVYKISNPNTLKVWKKTCQDNPHLYVGQNLFSNSFKLKNIDSTHLGLNIIKTPNDYINFIKLAGLSEE